MAKPMPVASTDGAGPSNLAAHRADPSPDPARRPRRRRKPLRPTAQLLAPSSTLLSLLATIASTSVVEGSPAPPAFLCPSVATSAPPTRRKYRRDIASTATLLPVQLQSRAVVRNIADKFEQGDDGIWRRVDTYTLYGVCPNCGTNAVSALDDQIAKPSNYTSTNTTSNMTQDDLKLPPGWKPVQKPYGEGRTTLILAMSLVLAFFICFLIIGCLFWRKSMRRKQKDGDVEGRGQRKRNASPAVDEAREVMSEKESKTKQKIWARATARWRANARYTARQRRGKRVSEALRSSQARRSSLSLDIPREGLTSGRSSPSRSSQSRSSSRRASSASFQQEPSIHTPSSIIPQNHPIPSISLSPPPPIPPSTLPPAYQQKSERPPPEGPSEGLYVSEYSTTASLISRSRQPSHSSFLITSDDESGDISSFSSIPAAHVATDDKAVLARLAEMASAPPLDETSGSPQALELQVSAPEWQDDDLEDLIAQADASNGTTALATSSSSPFPPPPSKGNLLAPNFYDYPYSFEEMTSMDLDLGPSAPPFEEIPSAPPVDENDRHLLPSAPPLIDDDDFYLPDPIPRAPESPSLPHHQGGTARCHDGDVRGLQALLPADSRTPGNGNPSERPQSAVGEGNLPVYRP